MEADRVVFKERERIFNGQPLTLGFERIEWPRLEVDKF